VGRHLRDYLLAGLCDLFAVFQNLPADSLGGAAPAQPHTYTPNASAPAAFMDTAACARSGERGLHLIAECSSESMAASVDCGEASAAAAAAAAAAMSLLTLQFPSPPPVNALWSRDIDLDQTRCRTKKEKGSKVGGHAKGGGLVQVRDFCF